MVKHTVTRCVWAEGNDPVMTEYHDKEWGVPQYDSRALWEMLMLEGFQAGLAWIIVLRKREAFRKAFAGLDPARVARFTKRDVARLMNNPGIIRASAKIEATIGGARAYLTMQEKGEDFSDFAWGLAGGGARRGRGITRAARSEAQEAWGNPRHGRRLERPLGLETLKRRSVP